MTRFVSARSVWRWPRSNRLKWINGSCLTTQPLFPYCKKKSENRREAVEEAKKANRADLLAENEAEIKVLETFLPNAMSRDELRALAQNAIAEAGASTQTDMGKVMKLLMPKVAGRAAGDQVSSMVKELLTKQNNP